MPKENLHKNDFCYSFERWDLVPESKKALKNFVLDAFDNARGDISNPFTLGHVYFDHDSPLTKFTPKERGILMGRLEDAVKGKPFIGDSATSDLVLEELLFSVITFQAKMCLAVEDEEPEYKKSADQLREIYFLNTGEKAEDKDELLAWIEEELWYDMDWLSLPVDVKEYRKLFLSNKSLKSSKEDMSMGDM